jgi:hypothetical protein
MTDLTDTLNERGTRYGEFKDQAVYADGFNEIMQSSPNWKTMQPDQREALRIIANKIGRILNGDPDYADSWHDIAGYATLVDKRLIEAQAQRPARSDAWDKFYREVVTVFGTRAESITDIMRDLAPTYGIEGKTNRIYARWQPLRGGDWFEDLGRRNHREHFIELAKEHLRHKSAA